MRKNKRDSKLCGKPSLLYDSTILEQSLGGWVWRFRINHGKVILPAFGKRAEDVCGFKAVCQHLFLFKK